MVGSLEEPFVYKFGCDSLFGSGAVGRHEGSVGFL